MDMEIWHAVILGIVEGITEFLPISSTGHLVLASSLLGISQTDFQKSFEICIQLGAILAVVVLYFRSFLNIEMLKKLFVAFLPTALIGLTLYKLIKTYLLGNVEIVIATLFFGGIALIAFEYWYKKTGKAETTSTPLSPASLSYTQAFLVGIAQSFAIIPGLSRSAATILGGLVLGLSRSTIVEFSFLLAVPTMLAATGLDLLKSGYSFSNNQFGLLSIGFVISFIVAMLAIKFFLKFVRTNNFTGFGIYRILAGIVFALLLL